MGKRKPNLKKFQLFGCKAYTKSVGPLKKLDERSKKYIFVEYTPAKYRLWDPEEKKIKIATDIKFKYAMYKDNISDEEKSSEIRIDIEKEEEGEDNEDTSIYEDVESKEENVGKKKRKKMKFRMIA